MPDRRGRPINIADDLQSLPLPPEQNWVRPRRPRRGPWPLAMAAGGLVVVVIVVSALNGTRPTQQPEEATLTAQSVAAAPEPQHTLPGQCDERLQVNASAATSVAWAPDSSAFAISDVVDGRARVVVMTAPDWRGRDVGEGSDPKWSASSAKLAYLRGTTVVIADAASGRELGKVTPGTPGFGWNGDTLLYWGGTTLRAWRDGRDARFAAHAPDLTPIRGPSEVTFSGNGARYAIVAREGAMITVLYGDTADGRVSLLPGLPAPLWSPAANALFTGSDQVVLLRAEKHLLASESLPSRFAIWSPDGDRALFGAESSGASWDVVAWDGQKMGASVRIASGMRTGAFSPDASYLAGIYNDGLRIYRCSRSAPTTAGLITRDQAKQIIQRGGDVIRVNLEDSKLVRWTDVASVLTGSWANVTSEAADLEPSAPVWLLMYAGEAKQPQGTNLENPPGVRSPTVSLVLYVLDAKSGHLLGARVASGTWWIGQPFESLTDRAPDATPHPFEPRATAPPFVTPRPTPTLPVSTAAPGVTRVESAPGGWRIDFPEGWWPTRSGFGGASLSTRDPAFGFGSPIRPSGWTWTPPSLRIEVWANPGQLDLNAWVAANFADNLVTKAIDRTQVTIAGTTAILLRRSSGPQPPDNSMLAEKTWIVPTTRADRVLVITATPADSVYQSELDASVASLAVFSPQAPSPTIDISRQQVLERWTNGPLGTPGRVEAKLVKWSEANAGGTGNGLARLDRDPDQLVWIVAVSVAGGSPGFTLPSRGVRGGDPFRWTLYVTPASSSDDGNGGWSQSSGKGDWPEFFDTLVDRCC
jgi:hypothetical protein